MEEVEKFNRKVARLHGTLEVACMELAEAQTGRTPRDRTRAFGEFVRHMENAIDQYKALTDD
jgi:hypothetical protein